eukprot:Lithocolla_globosa_v1_NODE_7446_length_946_cov_34.950617.p1 type:complete len:178 gc:universal NODE_7446_length_946_cov_34.950617:715-182(-)
MEYQKVANAGTWSSGLFECFNDIDSCVCGFCCLPCLASRNSAQLDGQNNCCLCLYPGSLFKNRLQASSKFHIRDGINSHCSVFCLICWCGPCSECQISRQLKSSGSQFSYEMVNQAQVVTVVPQPSVVATPQAPISNDPPPFSSTEMVIKCPSCGQKQTHSGPGTYACSSCKNHFTV